MAYSKISVTIPEEILNEVKKMAFERETKISRVVTEALAEKIKKAKQDSFIAKINKVFEDAEVTKEQLKMSKDIAVSTNIKELPW